VKIRKRKQEEVIGVNSGMETAHNTALKNTELKLDIIDKIFAVSSFNQQ
jgi:hypothetical protein